MKYPLTSAALEKAAAALAVAVNGGDWNRDYTTEHKDIWRAKVLVAMNMQSSSQDEPEWKDKPNRMLKQIRRETA